MCRGSIFEVIHEGWSHNGGNGYGMGLGYIDLKKQLEKGTMILKMSVPWISDPQKDVVKGISDVSSMGWILILESVLGSLSWESSTLGHSLERDSGFS